MICGARLCVAAAGGIAVVSAWLLLGAAAAGAQRPGATWSADGDVARAPPIETSDGAPASLEVRCASQPELRLTHPALSLLPVEREDRREGWYGIVDLLVGWNLDLRRPSHIGARTYWWRCPGPAAGAGCLVARDTGGMIGALKAGWSWFIRIEPPGGAAVDLRVSLAGSRRAIETACRGK